MDFQCTHEIFLQAGFCLISPWQLTVMTILAAWGALCAAVFIMMGIDRVSK